MDRRKFITNSLIATSGYSFTPELHQFIEPSGEPESRIPVTGSGWPFVSESLLSIERAQAYGRGLSPLESSFDYHIPEGESWTMNWLKHFY